MKKKPFIIILGAVGAIFLICWLLVIALGITNLSKLTKKSADPAVIDITLCDEDSSDLCIVNFGANNLNRMVINFQLPDADYPAFYAKAANRDTVSVYTCEVEQIKSADETKEPETADEEEQDETQAGETTVTETAAAEIEMTGTKIAETEMAETEVAETEIAETEVVEAAPIRAYCTGARTPLGETIDIEVYTTDGNKLIARGTFLVSAIALSTPIIQQMTTPISIMEEPPTLYLSPTEDVFSNQEITPTETQEFSPDQTTSTPTPKGTNRTPTATPDIAYP